MKLHKTIRLDEKLVEAINELAIKNRRKWSNQVECLLEDALNRGKVELPTCKLTEFAERLEEERASSSVVPVKPKKPVARFIKPTVDDVRGYCQEKGYTFDPEAWMAHYEANGWKVGRNGMKSWKAACTTWSKRESKNTGQQKQYLTAAEKTAQRLRDSRDPVKAMDF